MKVTKKVYVYQIEWSGQQELSLCEIVIAGWDLVCTYDQEFDIPEIDQKESAIQMAKSLEAQAMKVKSEAIAVAEKLSKQAYDLTQKAKSM